MASFINKNLRYIRKHGGMTQEQFASMIGIKRSLLGAYEEGRAEPNLNNLLRFAEILSVSVEDLVAKDLSSTRYPDSTKSTGFIPLVQEKAAAGYSSGYGDPEYLASLPVLQLPMLKEGNLRAFELAGDSMLPLPSGTIVITSYAESFSALKDGTCCVIITRDEGVVYKRIYNKITQDGTFRLVSDNPAFEPYSVQASEVLEVWVAKAFLSLEIPSAVIDFR